MPSLRDVQEELIRNDGCFTETYSNSFGLMECDVFITKDGKQYQYGGSDRGAVWQLIYDKHLNSDPERNWYYLCVYTNPKNGSSISVGRLGSKIGRKAALTEMKRITGYDRTCYLIDYDKDGVPYIVKPDA